jgi:hypothetical protein
MPDNTTPIEVGTLAQWVAASATLLAVLVALFKDEIVGWIKKPMLSVSIRLESPDCHKTTLAYVVQRTTLIQGSAECYYLRIWVENIGRTRAENVQVFASELFRRNADGRYGQVDGFLPMNLRWSHAQHGPRGPEIFADGISPGMGKHCDLGRIVDPAHQQNVGDSLPSVKGGQCLLALDLEVAPNTLSHLIAPGVYQLHLQVAASNCRPVEKVIELNLTGAWFPDQNRMFSDGLGIRMV